MLADNKKKFKEINGLRRSNRKVLLNKWTKEDRNSNELKKLLN